MIEVCLESKNDGGMFLALLDGLFCSLLQLVLQDRDLTGQQAMLLLEPLFSAHIKRYR